jgi:hypothetical protein
VSQYGLGQVIYVIGPSGGFYETYISEITPQHGGSVVCVLTTLRDAAFKPKKQSVFDYMFDLNEDAYLRLLPAHRERFFTDKLESRRWLLTVCERQESMYGRLHRLYKQSVKVTQKWIRELERERSR